MKKKILIIFLLLIISLLFYVLLNTKDKMKDYKTVLQEKLQVHGDVDIKYVILEENGPDHDKTFVAQVSCNGKKLAVGNGKNKKSAEMDAARKALERIK